MAAPKKQRARPEAVAPPVPEPTGWAVWQALLLAAVSLFLVFELYAPAMNGPFLLDDIYQFFGRPDVARFRLWHWVNNVRPLLNLSFYINYQLTGSETSSYHTVNVLLHWVNSVLVFFILRRLVHAAGGSSETGWRQDLAPLAGAALFLVHPVQTESVAYVSSRSEVLSILPAYAALLIFLARPQPAIGWMRAAVVIALFGAAVLTKEHVAVLPAIFVLADLYFHAEGPLNGLKSNWRLYVPLLAAAAIGMRFVVKTLGTATTAGFGLRGLTWPDYFFTQWRMFWNYLLLVVIPSGLNIDPDVAISRNAFDHGAIFAGAAIVALIAVAIVFRRRAPLASFGILAFIILLAPTSSVVPIRDVFAERRLYLPMIGLLCVAVDGLRRVNLRETASLVAIGGVLAIASYLTWQRAHVWSSGLALWEDSVSKSPNKYRPRFQYAYALYHEQRCTEAAEQYSKAAVLDQRPGERLIVDWALALDCAGRTSEAVEKLRAAVETHPTGVVYMNLAMFYGKTGRNEEALAALAEAEKQNPRFAQIYAFRGNVYLSQNKVPEAVQQYRKALQLDPANQTAMHGLRSISGQ